MEEEANIIDTVSFQVDAGLIDRLGRELVGRAETAVSELVKNSYDADATTVDVKFINSNEVGGTLKIVDNGLGMTRTQLVNGFMTISSTDKIHNPKSIRYERSKAGRKGIGRFATHRLGRQLTIITQTKESEKALKLSINWDDYKIDTNLISIKNIIEETDKVQEEGTILIIDSLREYWTDGEIRRVYRYISDLLQPDYLSDRSEKLKLAIQTDASFRVKFTEEIENVERVVADPDKMIFDKALAIIEGWVDNVHDGFCQVISSSLDLDDDNLIPILFDKDIEIKEELNGVIEKIIVKEPKYKHLKNIHFKAYYFIYNREDYYTNISKIELNSILKISSEQAGIKVYRNGFRVLPYGEPNNDWLNLDRISNFRSGVQNIPFGNKNLFGFVEIINSNDQSGVAFEETASREGLLENDSYDELQDFVFKSLKAAEYRLRFAVEKIKKEKTNNITLSNTGANLVVEKNTIDKLDELEKQVNYLIENKRDERNDQEYSEKVRNAVRELKIEFQNILDELGMLRVLAGLGLTIGEFTHEVVQFSPSMNGDLSVLGEQKLEIAGINSLENLKRTIKLFTSYTAYFNATVSANVSRELKPQELDIVVNRFKDIIEADLKKLNIELITDFFGYELITVPMHSSEWSSILFNLYTNSKKAIRRANSIGKIKIVSGKEENKVYLEFLDNGDGIPEENKEKIFDAFFTTSSPVGFDASQDERLTGTGLGLKIVRDIVQTYGGTIDVVKPETNFNTCFRIEIPVASPKQKEEYGI